MPNYEWVCRPCLIYWDRECKMGKAPDRTRCPKCNKLSERYFDNANVGVSFGDDKDFQTVRSRYAKHAEKGYDKTAGDRFLRRQIAETKEATDDETYRYKPMSFDYERMAKDGVVTKLSDKESADKVKRAKKLTEQAYDRANNLGHRDIGKEKLDIRKPQKQQ